MPFQRPAPNFRNAEFEGCWLAEALSEPTTGGDGLFLEVRRTDGQFLLLLIDVAGHDLTAARIGDEIEGHLITKPQCHDVSPGELLSQLNFLLESTWDEHHRLVTALAVRLNGPGGRIEGSSAGHPRPLVGQPGAAWSAWPAPGGPPLGAAPRAFSYPWGTCPVSSGQQVLVFTDGVTEAGQQAAGLPQFQSGPLQVFLAGLAPGTPLGTVVGSLWVVVRQHAGQAWPEDDVTLVGLHRR